MPRPRKWLRPRLVNRKEHRKGRRRAELVIPDPNPMVFIEDVYIPHGERSRGGWFYRYSHTRSRKK